MTMTSTTERDRLLWEAQAEHAIGVYITTYMAQHPAPPGSTVAAELAASGHALADAGRRHLDWLRQPHLHAAAMPEVTA